MVLAGQAHQPQVLLGLIHHQEAGAAGITTNRIGLPLQLHGQRLARLVDQAQGEGNHQGLLVALARSWGGVLAQLQLQHPGLAVPVALHMQHRRAGLVIPAAELGKIKAGSARIGSPGLGGSILHRLHEVSAGGG